MGKRCRQAGVQSGAKNREGVPSLVCFSSGGQVSKPIATAWSLVPVLCILGTHTLVFLWLLRRLACRKKPQEIVWDAKK